MNRFVAVCVMGAILSVSVFAQETNSPPEYKWTGSVYGGLIMARGNVNQSSYRYTGDMEKQNGIFYRYILKGSGKYSKRTYDKGKAKVNESKSELSGEMRRRLLSDRWFYSGMVSIQRDRLKDLSYRTMIGPGIGYYLVNTNNLIADVSSGFLYTHEKGAGEYSDYLSWRLSQRLNWQMTKTFKFWTETDLFVNTRDAKDSEVLLHIGCDSKINTRLSLVVEIENEYDRMPDEEGYIKRNDFELTTGLRYRF